MFRQSDVLDMRCLALVVSAMMSKLAVVILAAGKGTRMNSKTQKILHDVGGRPMVAHVFEATAVVADLPPVLVVGPGEYGAQQLFGEQAWYVTQAEQLGTGHAALMAKSALEGKSEQVIVTYADMPLLRPQTLRDLALTQAQDGVFLSMLSVMGEPTSTFGRVVRNKAGEVVEIVEVAEAKQRPNTEELLGIRELNVGVYCFDAGWLWKQLPQLPIRQARSGQEYYLTDMVGRAVEQGRKVEAIVVEDEDECLGAGTREELTAVEKAFRRRANRHFLASGVTMIDPDTTYIDQTVIIGQDTVIWPNTYIQGNSRIGDDCVLGPNTIIRDAQVGKGCHIEQSVVEDTIVEDGTKVAPFSVLKS
jgi:bifunctional UDP-N-acetylglucosamine pyrophosphorylase/glucosamine-1-phosphate N-acetyltransferase